MEEQITFPTAKLAQKKGFKFSHDWKYIQSEYKRDKNRWKLFAPTQSLLQKWLREKHEIILEVITFNKGWLETGKWCYQYHIKNRTDNPNNHLISRKEYKTWEEETEEGLMSALSLIKLKQKTNVK